MHDERAAHQMHFATLSPPFPVSSLSQLRHDAWAEPRTGGG